MSDTKVERISDDGTLITMFSSALTVFGNAIGSKHLKHLHLMFLVVLEKLFTKMFN